MIRPLLVVAATFCAGIASALSLTAEETAAAPPRLVVVISVDQLCQDYFVRFADNFSDQGFFYRVRNEGASYTQCHHRHAFTVTAPGHSVQLTGAYPNTNGIVGNSWLDRETGKSQYCVADPDVQVVGVPEGDGMSPKNLLVDTVGDVLRLKTNQKSKVFGIGVKDRAAILMTGHNANGAFWMQDNLWVTSTYYMRELPGYLRVINGDDALKRFYGQSWTLLLPHERYQNNAPDKNSWENPPKGVSGHFPHEIATEGEVARDILGEQVLFSPFGNQVTLDAAREIVTHEQLGQDEFPDILCINFSTNDYVGHAFGPHSLEVEDLTYRTDLMLGDFLRFLDEQVGHGNWTFALTADHGVAPVVEYAQQFHLPAKRNPFLSDGKVSAILESLLHKELNIPEGGPALIQKVEAIQVYLNRSHPQLVGERLALAQNLIRDWYLNQQYVVTSATAVELTDGATGRLGDALYHALHPRRSGDVLTVFAPYCVSGSRGTTHGSPWHYDTHVPMMLTGAGIKPGAHLRRVSPACLASTVAEVLQIDYPGGNVEAPLHEALAR